MWGICNYCKYYHEDDPLNKSGWCCFNKCSTRAEDNCNQFEPMEENKTMSKTKTEAKLKNLEGMKRAIEELVSQAWERGYKYGLYEANQKNQVKVLVGGEQVYPKQEAEND